MKALRRISAGLLAVWALVVTGYLVWDWTRGDLGYPRDGFTAIHSTERLTEAVRQLEETVDQQTTPTPLDWVLVVAVAVLVVITACYAWQTKRVTELSVVTAHHARQAAEAAVRAAGARTGAPPEPRAAHDADDEDERPPES